jgi:hypothetical protein
VSLKAILQDKYIEEHSALYWAIVKRSSKRPVESEEAAEAADRPDVLGVLLSYALPLKPSTTSELRLACQSVSDNIAFQRLRLLVPNFSSCSGADRILLGASLCSDVDVISMVSENNDGAFAVNMRFPQFHKRLMVSREVGVEFVVRNRIWRFSFMFTDNDWPSDGPREGTWCAVLCLPADDSSPPTWFDGRLVMPNPHKKDAEASEAQETPQAGSSSTQPLVNPDEVVLCRSKKRLESSSDRGKQLAVSLEESPAFASLQYAESSYVPADETLTVRLEGRLVKPPKS